LFAYISYRLTANALYSELPALVHTQPEKSTLATYLGIVQQVSNVIMFALTPILLGRMSQRRRDRFVAGSILTLEIAMFVLAFTWQHVVHFGSHSSSLSFLINGSVHFTFCAIGNVIFWTYISAYPEKYTFGFSIGQGIASAVTGLLPLAQDAGAKHMRFSTTMFFLIIGLYQLLMLAGFLYLQFHPRAHKERNRLKREAREAEIRGYNEPELEHEETLVPHIGSPIASVGAGHLQFTPDEPCRYHPLPEPRQDEEPSEGTDPQLSQVTTAPPLFPIMSLDSPSVANNASMHNHPALPLDLDGYAYPLQPNLQHMKVKEMFKVDPATMISFGFISIFVYGTFPAFLPFACLSYKHGSFIYNLATCLLFVCDPLGRILVGNKRIANFLKSDNGILFLNLLTLASGVYITVLAALSPNPIYKHSTFWSYIPVVFSGLNGACYSMSQTAYFLRLHDVGQKLEKDWAKLYHPMTNKDMLKEAERVEKMEAAWREERAEKRRGIVRLGGPPAQAPFVPRPDLPPHVRVHRVQRTWNTRFKERRRRHRTRSKSNAEFAGLLANAAAEDFAIEEDLDHIEIDGPAEDESDTEYEFPLDCDQTGEFDTDSFGVLSTATGEVIPTVSDSLYEPTNPGARTEINLSEHISRPPTFREIEATRGHLYTLGGLSVQIGGTLGSVVAMLVTVVFKLIQDPIN